MGAKSKVWSSLERGWHVVGDCRVPCIESVVPLHASQQYDPRSMSGKSYPNKRREAACVRSTVRAGADSAHACTPRAAAPRSPRVAVGARYTGRLQPF